MWLKIGRVKALFKQPKKLIETSGSESAYELYLAAKFFASLKAAGIQRDYRRSNATEERRKDEKSALRHCLGNGGIACVGPDYETAAYE
jgi:hypothetical protein